MDNKIEWIVGTLIVILFVGTGIFLLNVIKVKEEIEEFVYVTLESNAEVSLKVDDKEKVVEAIPLNEEAKILLSDLDLEGMTLEEGVLLITDNLYDMGYLEDKEMIITAANERSEQKNEIEEKIKKMIEEHKEIKVAMGVSKEVKANAEELKISNLKLLLINKAIEIDSTKTVEDLKEKTLETIYFEIKEQNTNTVLNYEQEKIRLIEENKVQGEEPVVSKKFKVTFVLDNGSKDIVLEVESGKPVGKINTPTKNGYKFLGWYIESKAFNLSTIIFKDTIVKAKWEKEVVVQPEPSTNTAIPESCFTFKDTTGGVEITEYSNTCPKAVIIPSKLNGKVVVEIGDSAFFSRKITSVTIPNSVTIIKNRAFESNLLTSVTIPNSVTTIGSSAFAKNLIASVTIPNSVTSLGAYSFSENRITSLTLPNTIKRLQQGTFSHNLLTSVTIPVGVETTGYETFAHNKLTSITIPAGTKDIGQGAFSHNQITNIILPEGFVYIYGMAFNDNKLPDNKAFIYMRNSDGSDTKWLISYAGAKRDNVIIPEGTEHIGHQAFYDTQLTSVTIPSSVKYISEYAFNNNKLSDSQAFIYKRNSDGSEDKSTIIGYGGLKRENVIIPSTVETIEKNTFTSNELKSITIPNSVKTIKSWSFSNNYLTSIVIPDSVTTIEDYSFANNHGLKSVGIPSNVSITSKSISSEFYSAYFTNNSKTGGTYTSSSLSGVWTKESL